MLGASRSASLSFVETEIDAATGAILARNPWNIAFGARIAFADLGDAQRDMTGDRREFIGRNGSFARPAALGASTRMSGRVGAALDPCAAMRGIVELTAGGVTERAFFLGETASREEARAMIEQYRAADVDALQAETATP